MAKLSAILLKILTNSFIVIVLSLLVGLITPEGSMARDLFSFIGFYGTIITANILVISIIVFAISRLTKSK